MKIKAADMSFHAMQLGDRPDSIFLHGFSADLHTWDNVFSELDGKLSALRYDLRGFGESTDPSDTPFSHAEDLLAICDALKIGHCNVIGSSMGGAIALNFALKYPQRVKKLVLISPAIVAWEWSPGWISLWQAMVEQARGGNMEQARQLWWQHPLFATTRNSPAAGELHESIMRFAGDQWVKDRQMQSLPDVDHLPTLKLPTLLLTGGRDMEDFRLIADVLEGSVEHLTRVDYPDLGHLLHLEDPVTCAAQLLAYLND